MHFSGSFRLESYPSWTQYMYSFLISVLDASKNKKTELSNPQEAHILPSPENQINNRMWVITWSQYLLLFSIIVGVQSSSLSSKEFLVDRVKRSQSTIYCDHDLAVISACIALTTGVREQRQGTTKEAGTTLSLSRTRYTYVMGLQKAVRCLC